MTLFGEMARPSDTNWSQVVLTTSVMVLVTAALVPTADSDRSSTQILGWSAAEGACCVTLSRMK